MPRAPGPAPRPLSELAALVAGEVLGDGAVLITGVAGLEQAGAGQLSFYGNQKYKAQLAASKAAAVLVGRDTPPSSGPVVYVRVDQPHLAFARIAQEFAPRRATTPGVSPQASVHLEARVAASAAVLPFATVARGAVVGERCVVGPGCVVAEGAVVGDDTVLVANVAVLERCLIGVRCLLHPGVVIGADGFGFAFDPSLPGHVKIPQTGIVRVEDDVEIGANSCVDRATTGETVIGRGSKIDNLVQVGHNSLVGAMSILCAQVGLSGSTELGTGVVLAGQVGVAGHLKIGDLAKVGAQSGVMSPVDDGATVLGAPAINAKDFLRSAALFARLPELNKTIRDLTRRLEALEQESKKP
ncbi:MAG: UDP-3-O-(3-hydroxymyristoyl)glucosamine N-acyltransferase [Myxococcaceae bacterium]|jgi:UDP-3-O-[3-hydroxymyristoyl] glucosamine N-acyltransferase|nr:UDP-3-O-(3-hydroxymyristoyl)glucosamine N-acyltransferase [Myxococcaceae bacterium]